MEGIRVSKELEGQCAESKAGRLAGDEREGLVEARAQGTMQTPQGVLTLPKWQWEPTERSSGR